MVIIPIPLPRYHAFDKVYLLPVSSDSIKTGGKLFSSFMTEMLFDSFRAALPKYVIDYAGSDPTSTRSLLSLLFFMMKKKWRAKLLETFYCLLAIEFLVI